MKDETENAIKMLSRRINGSVKPEDALKLTQAALNLAHTLQVMAQVEATTK